MKTAMQQLLEIVTKDMEMHKEKSEPWWALSAIKVEIDDFISIEREQIEQAFGDCLQRGHLYKNRHDYYTKKYENKNKN